MRSAAAQNGFLPQKASDGVLRRRCDDLSNPDMTNFLVSCLIIVGLVVSYLPQMWRIISRRSSEGLSPYFIMLGALAGTFAVANILTLPTSREDISCCKRNSAFACAAGLLGIAQISLQWTSFLVIMLLFLIFIPRKSVQVSPDGPIRAEGRAVTEALIVVAVVAVHFLVTLVLSVIVLARFPNYLQQWASFLGLCAAALAAVQYLPQIWTTWKLQHVGSLSIPMMCIQTPGGFVFAASLAARLGPSGWSAWATYLLLGTLQGVLLAMAISFEVRDYRRRRHAEGLAGGGGGGGAGGGGHHDYSDPTDEGSHQVEGEGDQEEDPLLFTDRRRSTRGHTTRSGSNSYMAHVKRENGHQQQQQATYPAQAAGAASRRVGGGGGGGGDQVPSKGQGYGTAG